MPIMKKGSKSKWTTIDNHCFFDKELRYKDIGLLCNMLALPDDWKFNVRGLASLHEDGVESVSNCLNRLIEKGYVYREQPNSSKGFKDIVYWVYEKPEDNPFYDPERSDSPCTENPYTGNPDTEKAYTEKRDLLNTKESGNEVMNKECINESDSEPVTDGFSEEEIMDWSDEELYSHLTDSQYKAFTQLLKDSAKGDLRTSKENLVHYFKKMLISGWRDSSGKRIRSIYGYVKMNFQIRSDQDETAEKLLKEQGIDSGYKSYRN